MHELPLDFDPSPFVGRGLDSMTFYEYMVLFNFEDGFTVSLESSLMYKAAGSSVPRKLSVPIKETGLLGLVGNVVVAAEAVGAGTFRVTFDDEAWIEFMDDPHFEAYRIQLGDHEIFV